MSPGLGVKKRGFTIPNDGGLVPQTLHIFKPTKSPTGAQNQAGLSVWRGERGKAERARGRAGSETSGETIGK